jgi:eukaryotic-like serine/threonine-protein kinase
MGAVYRVHSALSRRVVAALKVMKPTSEPDARARFVREAEALSALRHPAIVRVMGFNEDPERGRLYLVMELAVGETLRARMSRGPMALPEALATFVPLAQGLDHAHSEGIFHRDLKPGNVVLTEDGTPRLVDFGIASAREAESLTTTGQLGTLPYLPPEVFRGEHADPAAIDVYGFGLLILEALTGQRPFAIPAGFTPAAAAAVVGVKKLQSPAFELADTYPERLRELVRRATDPDPKARPSMREVRESLESLVERRGSASEPGRLVASAPAVIVDEDRTTRVPDPTPAAAAALRGAEATTNPRTRGRRRQDRLRTPVVAAAILAAVAVVGAALASMAHRPATPPPASAPPSTAPRAARNAPVSARPAPTAVPKPSAPSHSSAPPDAPTQSAASASYRDPLALPIPSATPARRPPAREPELAKPIAPVERVRQPPPEPAAEAPPASDAPKADFSGRWDLRQEPDATSDQPMTLGYRVNLLQDGNRVHGRGFKTIENGVTLLPSERTPIDIEGRIEGNELVLNFTDISRDVTSRGTIRYRLGPGGALRGRFSRDDAAGSGSSSAHRVP